MGEYSTDWTAPFRENTARWLWHLRFQPLTFLEIGVFEGRSAAWMLEYFLRHPESSYTGIDIWPTNPRGLLARRRAVANLSQFQHQVRLVHARAQDVLADGTFLPRVNLVYLDGDHRPDAVAKLSGLVWPRLATQGILIWDDLPWGGGEVERGIHAFVKQNAPNFRVLFRNWQLGIQKID